MGELILVVLRVSVEVEEVDHDADVEPSVAIFMKVPPQFA